MTGIKKDVKCPWCGESIPHSTVKARREKNDFGNVLERRCTKCGKLLAAYFEPEGGFLTRMRNF